MTGANKLDAATGVITVAVAGVNGSFSASDVHEWGTVLMNLAPLVLILFLIWRIYKLDQQHKECLDNHSRMQEQVLLAYLAAKSPDAGNDLPSKADFMAGSFNVKELLAKGLRGIAND